MINIDWVKARIFLKHIPIQGNLVFEINQETGETVPLYMKSYVSKGSYDNRVSLKTMDYDTEGYGTVLEIDGNLSKYINGHNVFCHNDVGQLLLCFISRLYANTPEHFNIIDSFSFLSLLKGFYKLNRVDVTKMYEISNDNKDVSLFISSLDKQADMKFRGRGTANTNSISFGDGSRYSRLIIYNKHKEVSAHQKVFCEASKALKNRLLNISKGYVRVELKMHLKGLQQIKLEKPINKNISNELEKHFKKITSNITMSKNIENYLTDEQLRSLPTGLRGTYLLWLSGESLKTCLSKNTFYTHKKKLLEYGINISLPCDKPFKPAKKVKELEDGYENLYERMKNFEVTKIPNEIENDMEDLESESRKILEDIFKIDMNKVDEILEKEIHRKIDNGELIFNKNMTLDEILDELIKKL